MALHLGMDCLSFLLEKKAGKEEIKEGKKSEDHPGPS